jgi:hypothetical protein
MWDCVEKRIVGSDLAADEKAQALRNLRRATLAEVEILCGVFAIKDTHRYAGEIFRGAHVRIFDMGARYDDWRQLPTASARRSSHRSDGAQYHVDGPLVHTVLFGRIGSWTWLQLEGNPQGLHHVVDFFKYKVTGKNQGPYGSSGAVDSRPVTVRELHPHVSQRKSSWVYAPGQARGSAFR